jgi:hypothetical protein
MAAQPIGRICACGCGASIDNRPTNSIRTRECQARFDNQKRKERWMRGEDPGRVHRRKPTNVSLRVRTRLMLSELPPRKQKPCLVCCGMPWARLPTRVTEGHSGFPGDPVTGDNGLCRGCGEPYAPEPPPSNDPVISSSAGVCERAAATHGYMFERGMKVNGQNYKNAVRGGKR